ncbi:MAG: NAD(P)/FAD-dependent oxidoreductase [Oscillospiraceae bacterium]|nr:NAD(P)/FAD-dependent oxidoreductase [Oscillospiraceae bacterium]
MTKIIVIGAGPAGLMAAGIAAGEIMSAGNGEVLLLERNPRVGRKIMITGKGRCNFTNNCDTEKFLESIPTNPKFLYSALYSFSPADTIAFFENLGLATKTERGGRVFPASDQASDIVDALRGFVNAQGVGIRKNSRAVELIFAPLENLTYTKTKSNLPHTGIISGVKLDDGSVLQADAVILASGGSSYPQTGSTGDGYKMAEKTGHTIVPLRPALVPLELCGNHYKLLQGLTLKNVVLDLKYNGDTVYKELGELLFTHFGVSGPLVLSASSKMQYGNQTGYTLHIDLKPGLNGKTLDKRLLRDFSENSNKDFINSLSGLLPKKMIRFIVELSGIPERQKTHQITAAQRERLVNLLKNLTFEVKGTRPLCEAIVTGGGIKTNEINPKTMESKLIKNLFFAGEIIDTDGFTGGFNMQIAFSTGYIAGKRVSKIFSVI